MEGSMCWLCWHMNTIMAYFHDEWCAMMIVYVQVQEQTTKMSKKQSSFHKKHTYTRYHHCHCRSCAPSSHTKFLALSHTLSLSMLETIYSNFHQPSEIFSFYLIQYLLDNCQCYTNSHANKIVNASVEGVAVYSCYCCCYCYCVCVCFFLLHIYLCLVPWSAR